MRIFLAFPFTSLVNPETGKVLETYQSFLTDLYEKIESAKKNSVFLAHRRELWGKNLMTHDICTPLDYEEMKNADIVIAFLDNGSSGGVHIELGWASAMKKRIILFLDKRTIYSPLVLGLNTVTDVSIRYYDRLENCLNDELIESIKDGRFYIE